MTAMDLTRQFLCPAISTTDNPSTESSVNTTAPEGQYEIKLLLNIHSINLKDSCEPVKHMLLGRYDAVMLTEAQESLF
jgi:hypothetical protein